MGTNIDAKTQLSATSKNSNKELEKTDQKKKQDSESRNKALTTTANITKKAALMIRGEEQKAGKSEITSINEELKKKDETKEESTQEDIEKHLEKKYDGVIGDDESQEDIKKLSAAAYSSTEGMDESQKKTQGFLRKALESGKFKASGASIKQFGGEEEAEKLSNPFQHLKNAWDKINEENKGKTISLGYSESLAVNNLSTDEKKLNASEQGKLIGTRFWENSDDDVKDRKMMQMGEVDSARKYANSLGGKAGEEFKAAYFKSVATHIKEGGTGDKQFVLNSFLQAHQSTSWAGAKEGTELDNLKKFNEEMIQSIGEELYGDAKNGSIVANFKDEQMGAAALVKDENGKFNIVVYDNGNETQKVRYDFNKNEVAEEEVKKEEAEKARLEKLQELRDDSIDIPDLSALSTMSLGELQIIGMQMPSASSRIKDPEKKAQAQEVGKEAWRILNEEIEKSKARKKENPQRKFLVNNTNKNTEGLNTPDTQLAQNTKDVSGKKRPPSPLKTSTESGIA